MATASRFLWLGMWTSGLCMSCERSPRGIDAIMSSQREPPTLSAAAQGATHPSAATPVAAVSRSPEPHAVAQSPGASDVSALRLTLRALEPLLSNPDVTEVCINRPQEAFIETGSGWRREALPFATFDWCRRLAKLVANSTRQRIDESYPLLSASPPGGERIQVVLPPATTQGCAAITIRRPSEEVWSISDLCKRGIFRMTRRASDSLDATETELIKLLNAREYESFMR